MYNISKYRAIIFDVGDTLLRREPSNTEVLRERLFKAGYSCVDDKLRRAHKLCEVWIGEQIMKEMNGTPRMSDDEFMNKLDRIAVSTIFDDDILDVDKIVKDISLIESRKQEWELVEGVKEVLNELKEKGFILAIVSNFNTTLLDLLQKHELLGYFSEVTVSSLVGLEKPDPKILHITCERIGVSPQDSLYIGDHPFDVLCAKNAGMDIMWICDEGDEIPEHLGVEPDYYINSVASIIDTYL